jgi:VanZ family protein
MTKSRFAWLFLLILYAGGIFALSSFPLNEGRPLLSIPHGDKLIHALEYALFYFLAWKVLPPRRRFLSAFLLTAVYAGSDEIHQRFVATRTASLMDWVADLAGGSIVALLLFLLVRGSLFKKAHLRILTTHHHDGEG